jgi:CPA1 family monovalent cation:H+ antiporter
MDLPSIVLVIAALLAVVSLAEPLAERLRLPATVILAVIGLVIGTASALLQGTADHSVSEFARLFGNLPINSQVFLFIFLPALLFQGALEADARDMAGDAVPIFMMAVVAVVVTTVAIGVALSPIAGVPLIGCLLVGAIVATTDPSAVIAIFRDLGAPQRLTRLVEGESLTNDAVAITLFVIFLGLLTTGERADVGHAVVEFLTVPIGGALLGFAGGRAVCTLFSLGGDNRLVQVSLTLALPYIAFVLAEHFHLSGPIAVVAAGLVLRSGGPARVTPTAWRYLVEVWGQLGYWASSLVFILAAILVPRLMGGFGLHAVGLLVVLIAMAFLARAAVLYGLLPVLSALKLSPSISAGYRAVILWGGLRGAATLALALAVTEHAGVPEDIKRFVAMLATAFVLFTLLVQGTTLRPLMRLLGMDRLSPVDALLREQALAWSHAEVRETIAATARDYVLAPELAVEISAEYADVSTGRTGTAAAIGTAERITLGMARLAAREHDLILEQLEVRAISPSLVTHLLAGTRRLLDAARVEGAEGYRREATTALAFSREMRLSNTLHTKLGLSLFLERQLATRFETLLVGRIVLNALADFTERQLAFLLGKEAGDAARTELAGRREATIRSIDALRLQYPDYADALERRFLRMAALRRERHGYERLHEEGLIGPEVTRALLQDVEARTRADRRPRLDLRLDTLTLIHRVPLFKGFAEADFADLARLMRSSFAIPGQRLISKGERGDAAWFIASGAVEVDTGYGRIRLGRGDFFGELALLTGMPRTADVTAIGYSELLVLYARDFSRFLDRHPDVRQKIEAVAAERLGVNRAGAGDLATA